MAIARSDSARTIRATATIPRTSRPRFAGPVRGPVRASSGPGMSLGTRTAVRLAMRRGEDASAARMRRRRHVPGRERLLAGDRTGERVVLAVGARAGRRGRRPSASGVPVPAAWRSPSVNPAVARSPARSASEPERQSR